jgi:hypothetical protein
MSEDRPIDYFTMRGESMTRIETFVAASFAFAITMMVISLGTIPDSVQTNPGVYCQLRINYLDLAYTR